MVNEKPKDEADLAYVKIQTRNGLMIPISDFTTFAKTLENAIGIESRWNTAHKTTEYFISDEDSSIKEGVLTLELLSRGQVEIMKAIGRRIAAEGGD